METITINEIVGTNGIFIKPEILSKFVNNKVQITIRQIKQEHNNDIMRFAGIIDDKEAEDLNKSIKECRKIDLESWQ